MLSRMALLDALSFADGMEGGKRLTAAKLNARLVLAFSNTVWCD